MILLRWRYIPHLFEMTCYPLRGSEEAVRCGWCDLRKGLVSDSCHFLPCFSYVGSLAHVLQWYCLLCVLRREKTKHHIFPFQWRGNMLLVSLWGCCEKGRESSCLKFYFFAAAHRRGFSRARGQWDEEAPEPIPVGTLLVRRVAHSLPISVWVPVWALPPWLRRP